MPKFAFLPCRNSHLTYIRDGDQDRIEDAGNNKSADTLDDVCRNAGSSTCTVDEVFTYEISTCNKDDVCNTAENDCNVTALLSFADFLIQMSGNQCNQSFDHESDRYINEISADQVRKCRANAACKKSPYRSKDHTGKDDDGITRMDVSACSRSWDTDGHGCHTGKCCK